MVSEDFSSDVDIFDKHKVRLFLLLVHSEESSFVKEGLCGLLVLSLLIQMPFDGWDGGPDILVNGLGRETRPSDAVAVVNGLAPCGWYWVACAGMEEVDFVLDRLMPDNIVCNVLQRVLGTGVMCLMSDLCMP